MDARAGVEYLRARPEVDRGTIGLVGHSEGGLIACMLAAQDRDLAFVVLMAAPGVPGWELACQQARRRTEIHGGKPEEAERQTRQAVALLRKVKDGATLRRRLAQMFSALPEAQRNRIIDHLMLPWQRHFATLNPAPYLRRVQCPVLALNGERDAAVEAKSNLAAIGQALKSGGNRDYEVAELRQLNHLFQTCTTGLDTEYWHLTETLSPAFLKRMVGWITKSCGVPRAKRR
jgi:pimeloyl-ACP methyl ester carboxylesterase